MVAQLLLAVGFVTLGGVMVAGDLERLLGGRGPVGPEDEGDVLKAQTLIQNKLDEQWKPKNEDGYNSTVTLDDVKVTKQIVAGVLYHFHFKAVHNFVCSDGAKDCISKPPLVQTCTATIFKAPGSNSNIEFAQNNDGPKCH